MIQEDSGETFAILKRLNKLQEEVQKIQESLIFERSSTKENDEHKEGSKYYVEDDLNSKITLSRIAEKEKL